MVSLGSSIMKNVIVFTTGFWARFPVKLIYCIGFPSALIACCLLKSYASSLSKFQSNKISVVQ